MKAVIKLTKHICGKCQKRDAVIVEDNQWYYCAHCKLDEIRRMNARKKTLPRSRTV